MRQSPCRRRARDHCDRAHLDILPLSKHPQILQRLHSELDTELLGRAPTAEDLVRLPYTLLVLKESMRLYPPVWTIARHAVEAHELGGVRVHKGSFVLHQPLCDTTASPTCLPTRKS